jgi:hypothetical protein
MVGNTEVILPTDNLDSVVVPRNGVFGKFAARRSLRRQVTEMLTSQAFRVTSELPVIYSEPGAPSQTAQVLNQ